MHKDNVLAGDLYSFNKKADDCVILRLVLTGKVDG
jgi:hypothetical protein